METENLPPLLDDTPTYQHLPQVYYHLGRALEGLGSPAAVTPTRHFSRSRPRAPTFRLSRMLATLSAARKTTPNRPGQFSFRRYRARCPSALLDGSFLRFFAVLTENRIWVQRMWVGKGPHHEVVCGIGAQASYNHR